MVSRLAIGFVLATALSPVAGCQSQGTPSTPGTGGRTGTPGTGGSASSGSGGRTTATGTGGATATGTGGTTATGTGGTTATGTGGTTATGTGGTTATGTGGTTTTGTGGRTATGTGGATTPGTGGTSGGTGGAPAGPTFGADTPAGRGGAVIKVTTLAASGPGSLDAAIRTAGPRIIVFEVGGVIDLNLARLTIGEPFVTIAGQTAPSPGITVIRGGMVITTHDVRMQHIRFRIGDAGQAPASGFEPDVSTDGPSAYNIVVDHCSVAWGVDENLSVSGPRFDGVAGTSHAVTLSNNIIAEGLYNSIHSKGIHSMGSLIHDYCTDVAVVGNLYAHNNERNPWFKAFGTGVVVNNVIYNPGVWAIRLGAVLTEWAASTIVPLPPRISIVGNVMHEGADTPAATTMVGSNSSGSAFLEDNISQDATGRALPIASATVTVLATRPSWPSGLVARPAADTVAWVIAHAGARPKDRDVVDTRIVADFQAGRGRFVNSQTEVGGYPTPAPTQRTLQVPAAADIDAWLAAYATALE